MPIVYYIIVANKLSILGARDAPLRGILWLLWDLQEICFKKINLSSILVNVDRFVDYLDLFATDEDC